MERPFNQHHVLWQRTSYRASHEKALRTHRGLVVPMDIGIHKDLHARVPTPPKPDHRLVCGSLEMLDDLPRDVLNNPPETVDAYAEWLMEQKRGLATRLGKNLLRQAVFIERGYYGSAA